MDIEIDTGKRREASEKAHGGAESDDERHVSLRGPGWGATSADECTDPPARRSNPAPARYRSSERDSGTHLLFWSLRRPHFVPAPAYAPPSMRRIAGGVGRTLVTVGILILLFVAYQLWGTGLYEAHEQDKLQAQFAKELAHEKAAARKAATVTTTTTVPEVPPPVGDAVAIIRIPKIGLERAVVQGIGVPTSARSRALPRDATAGAGGERRDRRPPDHLRRPVQPARRARGGRPDRDPDARPATSTIPCPSS